MPGLHDPTNHQLPQQPLHRCMFPKSGQLQALRGVTNPYAATVNGISYVNKDWSLHNRRYVYYHVTQVSGDIWWKCWEYFQIFYDERSSENPWEHPPLESHSPNSTRHTRYIYSYTNFPASSVSFTTFSIMLYTHTHRLLPILWRRSFHYWWVPSRLLCRQSTFLPTHQDSW